MGFAHSNQTLDLAPEVIVVPDPKLVRSLQDPADAATRFEGLTPRERLYGLLQSLVQPPYFGATPPFEVRLIHSVTYSSFIVGYLVGALLRTGDLQSSYARKHNAAVFEGNYRARRHYFDNMILQVARRGFPFALKVSLFSSSAVLACCSSIAYRNDIFLPDFVVGFATVGGLSRLWLGSRAVAFGAGFGSASALILYSCLKAFEAVTGQNIATLRLIDHSLWLEKREVRLRQMQEHAEQKNKKMFRTVGVD